MDLPPLVVAFGRSQFFDCAEYVAVGVGYYYAESRFGGEPPAHAFGLIMHEPEVAQLHAGGVGGDSHVLVDILHRLFVRAAQPRAFSSGVGQFGVYDFGAFGGDLDPI